MKCKKCNDGTQLIRVTLKEIRAITPDRMFLHTQQNESNNSIEEEEYEQQNEETNVCLRDKIQNKRF